MASQVDVAKEADQIQQAVENDNQDFGNPIIISPSNGNNDNLTAGNDVCRDFLRNCCRRGPNCRFSHPELSEGKKCDLPMLTFCHDFQNRECRRPNCKFVHCSKQDEELFKQTGKLPEATSFGFSAGSQSANGSSNNQISSNNGNKFNGPKKFMNNNPNNGVFPPPPPLNNNFKEQEAPICKDFVKGDCFRGAKCKFKHIGQPDRAFNGTTFDGSFESVGKQFGCPTSAPNEPRFQNQSNVLMQPAQRFDPMNQMKSNSPMGHPVNRESSPFQMPVDRRNNMRGTPMFEPDAKRRAFDSGYNTPTTFTFANNNANSQLLVTNALNQIHNNASHPNSTNTPNPETSSQSAQTAVLAAAVNAINELNGSNVTTSSSANTITRSMYNNLNESRFLLEENNNLRREIDKLKQQVVDLMNANEFLLEQNAQLRNLSILPATSVNQAVSTTLHNPVTALHSNSVVQKASISNPVVPTSSQPTSLQAALPPHINPSTISNTELLVANHLHRQSQQINQQRAAAAAVAAVASATSSALSSMSSNPLTSNPLSAASSISSLTVTSTSAPLVSYPIIQSNNPIMSASIPHSLGHLTH